MKTTFLFVSLLMASTASATETPPSDNFHILEEQYHHDRSFDFTRAVYALLGPRTLSGECFDSRSPEQGVAASLLLSAQEGSDTLTARWTSVTHPELSTAGQSDALTYRESRRGPEYLGEHIAHYKNQMAPGEIVQMRLRRWRADDANDGTLIVKLTVEKTKGVHVRYICRCR